MILTFHKEMELNFSTSVNLLKLHSNDGHDHGHDQTSLHHESGDCIIDRRKIKAEHIKVDLGPQPDCS
ncbi:hypothetical protein KSP40_PGU012535 [Platanthera guangdongensis]|uniref:Uncharacterized protein n=1 Tax=Platanthera guangdongensis TaxID=2320717 RepID=A0ABR2LWF4_9ASPA